MCPESCAFCNDLDSMCPCFKYEDLIKAVENINDGTVTNDGSLCDYSGATMTIQFKRDGEIWPESFGAYDNRNYDYMGNKCRQSNALIAVNAKELKACRALISTACASMN